MGLLLVFNLWSPGQYVGQAFGGFGNWVQSGFEWVGSGFEYGYDNTVGAAGQATHDWVDSWWPG